MVYLIHISVLTYSHCTHTAPCCCEYCIQYSVHSYVCSHVHTVPILHHVVESTVFSTPVYLYSHIQTVPILHHVLESTVFSTPACLYSRVQTVPILHHVVVSTVFSIQYTCMSVLTCSDCTNIAPCCCEYCI